MPTFDTQMIRFGLEGMNLTKAADLLSTSEATRLINVTQNQFGGWTTRPGLEYLATAGSNIHSICRLNDPQHSTFTRIWGVDTLLYYGQDNVLNLADSGFSGNPLSLVPYRVPFSGQTWMYVGNDQRMRKIDINGVDLPIGLPAPSTPTTVLGTELTVLIEDFESGFGARAGTGAAPTLTYPAAKVGNGLNILTAPGAATSVYYNYADKTFSPIDLTTFGSGIASTDEDFIHLWLKVDLPQYVQEVVVYLTTSAFTANVVPGMSATQNLNAFMKAFEPSDFTLAVEQVVSAGALADSVQSNYTVNTGLSDTVNLPLVSQSLNIGRSAWTEYGIVDVPLRKGDFTEIGTPTWNTVQGVTILIRVSDPAQVVNATIDNMYLTGGRGLDSAEPTATPYDYRITNYDTRTGSEGNPSAVQVTGAFLESLRRAIVVTIAPYGDSAVQQRVYRRGGSLVDDWYFVASNGGDGAAFTDTLSDAAIEAAGTVETDNFQPVPTVNSSGVTVLHQPLPYLWGPAYDLLFACGDPYRPGFVYWCKPGNPDSWPDGNQAEVCSTSEQLMNGTTLGGQAYVFSRERMYVLISNISTAGSITPQPTSCTEGLISPWALTTGGGAIFFVSATGVYMTTGGEQTNLSDSFLRPLFNGEESNTFFPINFGIPNSMRLNYFQNELYFTYEDTNGHTNTLIYGLLPTKQFWRIYEWEIDITGVYVETAQQGRPNLILGGGSNGTAYTHSGILDAGGAITCRMQTGYIDQGVPRQMKLYAGDIALYAEGDGNVGVRSIFNFGETDGTSITKAITTKSAYIYDCLQDNVRSQNISLEVVWTGGDPTIFWTSFPFAPDPTEHIRWDTDWIDHGLVGWQVPIFGEITLISSAPVALTMRARNYTEVVSEKLYTFVNTGGEKQKLRIDFEAQRGVQFHYVFTSMEPFQIYWEESAILVQQWGNPGTMTKYVLGAERGSPITKGVDPSARSSIAGGG